MIIENINPGTDTIPTNLNGNTIYKLDSGKYINTETINISNNCTGIIGEGDTFLYGSSSLSSYINMTSSNNIISSVKIDGSNDGLGGPTHVSHSTCIYTRNTTSYSTFTNLDIFNCGDGIILGAGGYIPYGNTIMNSNIYNNNNGIVIWGYVNLLNNINVYNNSINGIKYYTLYGTINNLQTFNNGGNGLYFPNSGNSYFNNIQSYNNGGDGLNNYNSNAIYLNNIQSYNNNGYGLWLRAGFSVKNMYYNGYVDIFDNISGTIHKDLITFTPGITSIPIINDLTLSPGILSENTITYDSSYTTLPSIVGWSSLIKGTQNLIFDGSETYIYGSNIPNQTQPTRLNGTTFELYGIDGIDYDSSKKVGEW